MQEDKEIAFDAIDTVNMCLDVFAPMVKTMVANEQAMYEAAKRGYINATDVADYLAQKGVPFRTAYHTVGQIVAYCSHLDKTLDQLTLDEYRAFCPIFEEDIYQAIALETCVNRRVSVGGTSVVSVEKQIEWARNLLKNLQSKN
jgi:argininosuccinate lyase